MVLDLLDLLVGVNIKMILEVHRNSVRALILELFMRDIAVYLRTLRFVSDYFCCNFFEPIYNRCEPLNGLPPSSELLLKHEASG